MPPETTNNAKSSAMNCTYSTPVAISGPVPAFMNIQIVVGTPSAKRDGQLGAFLPTSVKSSG